MEGLHFRKKQKINIEDETEFLDEEEQEKLIEELRQQNDTANKNIQRGLILIGLVVSSLFFNILVQGNSPTIPITHLYKSELSTLKSPRFAAILNIISIFLSIFTLFLSSKVIILKYFNPNIISKKVPLKYALTANIIIGSISPVISILHHTSSVELVFWSIPFILGGVYYFAYSMINQVYEGLDELEGSKYKYKGA